MPMISAANVLVSPLSVTLQEVHGLFGPRVRENLFVCDNLHVMCTKSGKIGKKEMKSWLEEVFVPSVASDNNKRVALILDSFGGHKSLETAQNVQIILLPPGATSG